jgi:hypothetical protein
MEGSLPCGLQHQFGYVSLASQVLAFLTNVTMIVCDILDLSLRDLELR